LNDVSESLDAIPEFVYQWCFGTLHQRPIGWEWLVHPRRVEVVGLGRVDLLSEFLDDLQPHILSGLLSLCEPRGIVAVFPPFVIALLSRVAKCG